MHEWVQERPVQGGVVEVCGDGVSNAWALAVSGTTGGDAVSEAMSVVAGTAEA